MNKTKGLLNIARKAGFLIIGKDNLIIYTKKLYLLLVDKSAGNSLEREMKFISENRKIPLIEVDNLAELMATANCKALGIRNKAMSDELEKSIKGE